MPPRGSLMLFYLFIYLFPSDVVRHILTRGGLYTCHNITTPLLNFSSQFMRICNRFIGKTLGLSSFIARFPSLTSTCTHLCLMCSLFASPLCPLPPCDCNADVYWVMARAHAQCERKIFNTLASDDYISTLYPAGSHRLCIHYAPSSLPCTLSPLSLRPYRGCLATLYSNSTWALYAICKQMAYRATHYLRS